MPHPQRWLMLKNMHSRIVFIESRPGGLAIDALTSEGRTLSMDAQVPVSTWGLAAAMTLGRWAEQGSQVEVDLRETRGVSRVRFTDEEHKVVLDLTRLHLGPLPAATVAPNAGEHREKEPAGRGPGRVAARRVAG